MHMLYHHVETTLIGNTANLVNIDVNGMLTTVQNHNEVWEVECTNVTSVSNTAKFVNIEVNGKMITVEM